MCNILLFYIVSMLVNDISTNQLTQMILKWQLTYSLTSQSQNSKSSMPFMCLKNKWSSCSIRFRNDKQRRSGKALTKTITHMIRSIKFKHSLQWARGQANEQQNRLTDSRQSLDDLFTVLLLQALGLEGQRQIDVCVSCLAFSTPSLHADCSFNHIGAEQSPNLTNRLFVQCLNYSDLCRQNGSGHIDHISTICSCKHIPHCFNVKHQLRTGHFTQTLYILN